MKLLLIVVFLSWCFSNSDLVAADPRPTTLQKLAVLVDATELLEDRLLSLQEMAIRVQGFARPVPFGPLFILDSLKVASAQKGREDIAETVQIVLMYQLARDGVRLRGNRISLDDLYDNRQLMRVLENLYEDMVEDAQAILSAWERKNVNRYNDLWKAFNYRFRNRFAFISHLVVGARHQLSHLAHNRARQNRPIPKQVYDRVMRKLGDIVTALKAVMVVVDDLTQNSNAHRILMPDSQCAYWFNLCRNRIPTLRADAPAFHFYGHYTKERNQDFPSVYQKPKLPKGSEIKVPSLPEVLPPPVPKGTTPERKPGVPRGRIG